MTPPRTNWRSAPKAKSVDEIKARYKVYRNVKTEAMHVYACQLYRDQLENCPFLVRWNVQSGQVWESGVHNHGPEAYPQKVIYKAHKEWRRLANGNSFLEIRRQHLVRKSCTRDDHDYMLLQCISYKRDKCPYIMRWFFKTGELFETGAHNHEKVSASRMRIHTEWQLLDGNSAHTTMQEIRRRFCVTMTSRSPKHQHWFKCSKCNGKKCDFHLRWERNDGNILWNGKQQCQHAEKSKGSNKEKKKMLNEEPKDESLQQNQQQNSEQNENASSLEIQIVEELNHDFKCPPLPAMKLEAATEKEAVEHSASAGTGHQTSLPLSTIDGETETQLQFWHPKLKTVKKEEPNDVEEPADAAVTVILTGRKEVAGQAPTKMLLRERKRPPNYAEFDGNKKKRTLRSGGTKK